MRVIFLFFLFINVAYFYTQSDWFNDKTGPAILKQQTLPNGVERLSLLRERGLGDLPSKAIRKAADPEVKPEISKKKPVNEVAKVKPAPKPQKPKPKPKSKPKPVKSPKLACYILGPFRKAASADRAAETIGAMGVNVKQRQVSQRKPRGYWVYLPAFKTYDAARKKVNALQKKGLKDLFIMGKGQYKNAVSLGLFKREIAADERFQFVKKMGLSVKKETQFRVTNQIWLDIKVSGNKTKTVASLTETADQYSRTNLSKRKCE